MILFLLSVHIRAQENHAINQQIKADQQEITITYDLPPNGEHVIFTVYLKVENSNIKARTTHGTGENVVSGNQLNVVWYFTRDGYTKDQLEGQRIYVLAVDPLQEVPESEPPRTNYYKPVSVWVGTGSMLTSGLGLLGYGLFQESKAQKDYEIYQEYRNPEAKKYLELELSREELYEDANARHKRSQIMMIGGGVILAGTAVILIRRYTVNKRLNQQIGSRTYWEIQPMISSQPNGSAMGINWALSF